LWQWTLIIGGAVAYLALLYVAEKAGKWPILARIIWPVLILYLGFGVLAWIADPLFNLLLRLDRFGRLALSPSQLAATNVGGLCLAGALVGVMAAVITWEVAAWGAAALCGLLIVPVTGIFNCPPKRPRRIMTIYTVAVALVGATGVALLWLTPDKSAHEHSLQLDWAILCLTLSALGIFLSGGLTLLLPLLRSRD